MPTATADLAAERAVFVAIAQDPAVLDGLREVGCKPEWFSSRPIRRVVSAAMQLRMKGNDVTLLAVMSRCNSTVSSSEWAELIPLWQEGEKHSPIKWQQYVPPLREFAMLRAFDSCVSEAMRHRRSSPHEVQTWLPATIAGLRAILADGSPHDPRPSAIWSRGYIPQIIDSLGIPTLDKVYRGGLWDGLLAVWGIPSGHGKSRLSYTMAAWGVARQHRVALVSLEALPVEVVGGILGIYGGFSGDEIRKKRGSDSERDAEMTNALQQLDRNLFVFGHQYGDKTRIGEILDWVRPHHLIIDHLTLAVKANKYQKEHEVIADLVQWLLQQSRDYKLTITAMSQLPADVSREFKDKGDVKHPRFFGSSRVLQAADIAVLARRDPVVPQIMDIILKKDRPEGTGVDARFKLRHDPVTRSFYEMKE